MHTITLDDGTKAVSTGRLLYIPDNEEPERFPGAYQERGRRGIAWRIMGAEIEVYEEPCSCDDAEHEGCVGSEAWRETGRVVAVMVGDDERHAFEPAELEPIGDLDYCAECGQIGCTHDGRDRDEEVAR